MESYCLTGTEFLVQDDDKGSGLGGGDGHITM